MMSRCLLALLLAAIMPVQAQDVPEKRVFAPTATPVISRSPAIDGVADDDEWTSAGVFGQHGTRTGVSWDSGHVYLMLSGKPMSEAAIYIDAAGDGWREGADNYELALRPSGEAVAVTARLFNSSIGSRQEPPAPAVVEARAATATVQGASSGSQTGVMTIELALTRNESTGLAPAPGRHMGIGASIAYADGSGSAPAADPNPETHLIQMVEDIVTPLEGLEVSLRIKDRKLVPGQTLSVDFFATNVAAEPLTFRNFTISGERRIDDLMNALKVRGDTLEAGKGLKHGYSTDLPKNMPIGSFLVKAEMNLDSGAVAAVSSSFEVVETFDARLDSGSGPLAPGRERRVKVHIRNYQNRPLNGTVRLFLPPELATSDQRTEIRYLARGEDSEAVAQFKVSVPAGTAPGIYDFTAEVAGEGTSRTLGGSILVERASE